MLPQEATISEELTRRILGLGFLDLLLPPTRTDISEITIYSSGLLQIMLKGSVRWETIELHLWAGLQPLGSAHAFNISLSDFLFQKARKRH